MKKAIGITLGTLLSLGVAYMGGIGYYAEKFTPNTSYGPVSIGNLTVDEAQEKIAQDISKQSVTLVENGKELGKISLADLGYQFDAKEALETVYQTQDPSTWIVNLFNGTKVEHVFSNRVAVNKELVQNAASALGIDNATRTPATNASIEYDKEKGYYVQPGVIGTQVDYERLGTAMLESLENKTMKVALEDVYAHPEIEESSAVVKDTMDYIQKILGLNITLKISGEAITIPKELIEQWVHFDADNKVTVDEEEVAAYLDDLNEKYSTEGKTRQFQSTLRGEVTVPAGILGWSIDTEQETQNIIRDLRAGKDVTRKAAFTGIGTHLGEANDIGDTYVEVDLENQMMYLYYKGEVIVATNIVSGKLSTPTAPGANAIIEMLTNTNLVGIAPGQTRPYSAPVSYWMRFDYQSQGIHDANWQYSFGGDTYLYSGSLGCINTPLDQVAIIYEYVEYGTPVIVF
ncbi:peptidoglycan binding domain-containing protein [Aerococcaceae bacterium zg-ZJ1578]|uniref:peptidoglycan binding domain-containing protein n=1 Tax=Aerococcaceae bacterium zg-252 TaxID=2796928 RepID=UPI001A298292|nr:peptidoglycan binding domain-containing protein [Aerococcaceae bacterium zg-1578]